MKHLAEAWLRTAARLGARGDVAGTGPTCSGGTPTRAGTITT